MSDSNVFIEAFTEVMNPRFVPIAPIDDIEEALWEVSETNDLYVENGQLFVPEEWLMAATLDFADWLCDHMPMKGEADLCRIFDGIPFFGQYQMYSATERVNGMEDMLSMIGGCPPDLNLSARLVADAILNIPHAMTVSYVSGSDEVDTFYVPEQDGDTVVDQIYMDAQAENPEPATPRIMCWLECFHAAVHCMMNGGGAFTICVHEDDAAAIGAILIAAGRSWIFSGEALANICMEALKEEPSDIARHLGDFVPGCQLADEARMLAACVASSAMDTVDIMHSYLSENDLDTVKGFSVNPAVAATDFDGNVNIYIVPLETSSKPLPNLFDDIIDLDPFMTGIEASQCVLAASVARASEEILVKGSIDETLDAISEFSSFVALDTNNRPFDRDVLMVVFDADSYHDDMKTMDMMLEMYEELDEGRKKDVDVIVEAAASDSSRSRHVLVLEGDGHNDGIGIKAHSAYIPVGMSLEEHVDSKKRLTALCTQCLFSPKMTMFLAKKSFGPSPSTISGVSWNGGVWSDLGPDKTLEFLEGTNIGTFLEIMPGDPLDYERVEKPGSN